MKNLIIIGLALFIFSGILGADDTAEENCILYDLEGNEVRLFDYRGKPLIICFWTTWCPYCRREMTRLNKIYSQLDSSGIELLAINVAERRKRVSSFVKSYSLEFKVLQDRDGECAFFYDVIGIPTYLLIDRDGKVKFKGNGFPEKKYKQLLLEESGRQSE